MTRSRLIVVAALVCLAVPAIATAQERSDGWGGGRAFVTFGAGVQARSPNFAYDYSTMLFDETARAALDIPGKRGVAFDIAGGVRVVQNLGVGVTYSRYSMERTATLSTTIPSPLFYGDPSTIERQIPLQRGEDAVHVQAIYKIPIAEKLKVGVFGGPTYFRCRDDVVTQFSILGDFSPSLDWSVAFKDVTMAVDKDNTWGFNGGADVTYLLNRYIGIGTTVRYSRSTHATVNHFAATGDLFENGVWGASESNGTVDMKHGGLHWNGGISFRF
jgi:hypothetical protein